MAGSGRHVVVIGAGIVGMACALFLQRDGHRVTVLDPRGPAGGASSGNAGVIATGSCIPIATPARLRQLPRLLLDRNGPLALRLRHLPGLAPWLWGYLRACRPARAEAATAALAALLHRAALPHRVLAGHAGAGHLLRWTGWLKVARTPRAVAEARRDAATMRAHGIAVEELGADELRQMEPALAPDLDFALHLPDCGSVSDPARLVRSLALRLAADGGSLRTEAVTGFGQGAGRVTAVLTEAGLVPCDAVVLAAGAWSKPLAAALGARVALDAERGYHAMLEPPAAGLTRPVMSLDDGFVLAPMAEGVRVTGGVELASLDAPPDYRRLRATVARARRLLPGLAGRVTSEWLGARPSLPDSLPVIGRAPDAANALLAFGHGHLGLTLGPLTGRLVADLVDGRDPGLDLRPYAPDGR
jgi:D-amino-acid dehydrogenase